MFDRSYRSSVLVGLFFLTSIGGSAQAADWPSEVVARYDISFSGFNVGTFNFRSKVDGKRYHLAGEANISAMFGAFQWTGLTRSSGQANRLQPDPKKYSFDFSSNAMHGSVRIGFIRGHIVRSDISPYKPYTNDYVPLLREHMRNVYDPISAVMALTRSANGNPCERRLPIFDGRQRFDLLLTLEKRKKITENKANEQPAIAYVCKVQYVPLGGYKPNAHTDYMAQNSEMRVVMRAVPSANLFIPYEVRVPTVAGEALLSARHVNIVTAQRQRIALVH